MSFALTPHRMAALYGLLRDLPPFSRWGLPVADSVEFRASKRCDVYGEHFHRKGRHVVLVSTDNNGHFNSVACTLAHEMIHVAQVVAGERTTHGKGFDRRAQAVGRHFGWDWRAL